MRPLVLLLLFLSGCALFGKKEEELLVYSIRPTAPVERRETRVGWQLVVETPSSSDALDSANILVMPTPGVVEVYKAARWNDSAPVMVRSLMVRAFQDSGRILGVGSNSAGIKGDYGLSAELRDFQAEYRDGVPYAVVNLHVSLLDYDQNRVVATRTFQMAVPSPGTDTGSVVTSFQAALSHLLPAVVTWTIDQGEVAKTQRAGL